MTKTMMADAVSKGFNGIVECPKDATMLWHIVSRCSRVFLLENIGVRKVSVDLLQLKANYIDPLQLLDQQRGVSLLWRLFLLAATDSTECQARRAFSFRVVGSFGVCAVLSNCPRPPRRQQKKQSPQ